MSWILAGQSEGRPPKEMGLMGMMIGMPDKRVSGRGGMKGI